MSENRTDNQYLIDELSAIRAGETTWNSPRGSALLALARTKLTGVARKLGAAPEDAVTAAWMIWSTSLDDVLGAGNPWAYTAASVRQELRNEAFYQAALTSSAGTKRVGFQDFTGFDRHSVETLDEYGKVPSWEDDLDAEIVTDTHASYQLDTFNTVYDIMIRHGHTQEDAELVIERILTIAVDAPRAPEKAARKDVDTPALAGLSPEAWSALVALVFGSCRGQVGLLEAETTGAEADQPYLQKVLARYEKAAAVAA